MRSHDQTSWVGDERIAQIEALYRAEYAGMVRLAYSLISNGAEAEELVQESFVELYRRFANVRQPKPYLRSAVVSRCRSVLRHRRVMSLHPPERPTAMSAEAGELWDVLAKLPDDQRVAVVLRYYCGYRASEISIILDRNAATVRSHLRRGLAQLKKELSS
ncbi:MAG: RNA polymerase sigma factor [Acidimicrobiales bacterium]